jgi:hypothetical protein
MGRLAFPFIGQGKDVGYKERGKERGKEEREKKRREL